MNNQLIKTDGILYKIQSFFRRLLKRNKKKKNENSNEIKNNFNETISYKKEIEEFQSKEKMAQKLLVGELKPENLNDKEVDEMIEYFKQDIEKQKKELERIKCHILKMKQEIQGNK